MKGENVMNIVYKTSAKSVGGSTGTIVVENSPLDLKLALLSEFKGKNIGATNPEQLFAAGYAACFTSALHMVIKMKRIDIQIPVVDVDVGLAKSDENGFFLTASVFTTFKNIEQNLADELTNEAHKVCPYSKAIKNNVDVTIFSKVE